MSRVSSKPFVVKNRNLRHITKNLSHLGCTSVLSQEGYFCDIPHLTIFDNKTPLLSATLLHYSDEKVSADKPDTVLTLNFTSQVGYFCNIPHLTIFDNKTLLLSATLLHYSDEKLHSDTVLTLNLP